MRVMPFSESCGRSLVVSDHPVFSHLPDFSERPEQVKVKQRFGIAARQPALPLPPFVQFEQAIHAVNSLVIPATALSPHRFKKLAESHTPDYAGELQFRLDRF